MLDRFPKFRELLAGEDEQYGKGLLADVFAGEVLFIPTNWWHQIENGALGFLLMSLFVDVVVCWCLFVGVCWCVRVS